MAWEVEGLGRFQPTPLHEERPEATMKTEHLLEFQPTPLHEERLQPGVRANIRVKFQPTPLHEERRALQIAVTATWISTHAPARGATSFLL